MSKLLIIAAILINTAMFAQEIRRPTAETTTSVSCGVGATWYTGAMSNFWDASGSSTSSIQTASGTVSVPNRCKGSILSGFAARSGTYSTLSIKIDWACSGSSPDCAIYYSLNSGSTWTLMVAAASVTAETTVSLSIPATQDLTALQIKWTTQGGYDTAAITSTLVGYDVRTEGVLEASSKGRFQVTTTE